jgi:hypothetical protein
MQRWIISIAGQEEAVMVDVVDVGELKHVFREIATGREFALASGEFETIANGQYTEPEPEQVSFLEESGAISRQEWQRLTEVEW